MLNRRKFLGFLSGTGLLAAARFDAFASSTGKKRAREGQGHVFLTKPYLQNLTETSITIMWVTARNSYSWVELGEAEPDKKAESVNDGLVNAYIRINRIVINGLKPGVQYRYRVCSKEIIDFKPSGVRYGGTIQSEVYSFSTVDPGSNGVALLILNDIHDRPESFNHLLALNGGDPFDFVFLNGDMFNHQSGEEQIIDHLLIPCTDSFATVKPFMFIRGNHETRGYYARNLSTYFENPHNQNYFSFKRGPVFFIALDTGEDKDDSASAYSGLAAFDSYREKQAEWLQLQMQSKEFRRAKFRVVMMHIPHYHSGDWHGTMHCRKVFGDLFNKYKIDLMICGHTHRHGVFEPEPGHNFPMIIGGGPQDGRRTLIKMKADASSLQLQMLLDDGSEAGRYHIKAK